MSFEKGLAMMVGLLLVGLFSMMVTEKVAQTMDNSANMIAAASHGGNQ